MLMGCTVFRKVSLLIIVPRGLRESYWLVGFANCMPTHGKKDQYKANFSLYATNSKAINILSLASNTVILQIVKVDKKATNMNKSARYLRLPEEIHLFQ
jgi:hypothetical protein